MLQAVRVLLVAESERDATWIGAALQSAGYAPTMQLVVDAHGCRSALVTEVWDVVLCRVRGQQLPSALESVPSADQDHGLPLIFLADSFEAVAQESYRRGAAVCLREYAAAQLGPALGRALVEGSARLDERRSRWFEDGQREVLERIAGGAALPALLEQIVRLVERQAKGMFCSIVLVEHEQTKSVLRPIAAPSLPVEYSKMLDGVPIGPGEGSCAAAAYLGERVIVEDIASHPNWAHIKHLALPFDLRACWSTPIFSAEQVVLGTFAMYYRQPRGPTAREIGWVNRATQLAAIALVHDRTEQVLRASERRYRQIVDTAYEGVWMLDSEGRTLFANHRVAQMLGYSVEELIGRSLLGFIDPSDHAAALAAVTQRTQGVSEQLEFRFRRRDGSEFWAIVSGSPVRDEHDQVVGMLGMITDVSEQKRTEIALRQSEAEFRAMFDNAGIGMTLLDEQGRFLRCNPALERILGYAQCDLMRMSLAELLHPDDRTRSQERQASLWRGESDVYRVEQRYLHRSGSEVCARLTLSPVRKEGDQTRLAIGMLEDISDRKRMEAAVRSSEHLRALVYNGVSDILFYVAVEAGERFRFLSVNPAFLKATGLVEERVVGQLVDAVIPSQALDQVLDHYLRCVRERRPLTRSEEITYSAGTRHHEVTVTPILDEHGQCTHLIGAAHDVTEHKHTQERLRAQAELLDRAKDAILVRDLEGVISFWNKGAERLYGWSTGEATGRPIKELIYLDPRLFEQAQNRLLETGAWAGELAQVTKHGRQVVIEASWTLLRDDKGQPKAVLAINSDITQRKALELQVLHAQRMESLGTLAGGIAHDFNNILAAIAGNVMVAQGDVGEQHPARKALAEIEQAGYRAADLVRQILTFSREHEPKRRVVWLDSLVEEGLKLLRATLPASIEINTHIEPELPQIYADPTQLHQVIMNLGTNAAHAIGSTGGLLSVSLERSEARAKWYAGSTELREGVYVQLTVADTGCGMDEATLARIFDPFFTTKLQGEGTGLGLSVVHGIVRSHDGAIVVRSKLGCGSSFTIYFPQAVLNGQPEPELPKEQEQNGGGERVLYLDDEVSIVRVMTQLLERLGYRPTGASNPWHALAQFEAHPYDFDLVLTDLAMPGMSGIEFVRALQKRRPELPIVLTSGRLDPEDARQLRELGVREFLLKPSTFDQIAGALKRALTPVANATNRASGN